MVVPGRALKYVVNAPDSSLLGVVGTIYNPVDPGQEKRSRAHWAGLQSGVESDPVEAPVVQSQGRLAKCQELRVGRGVLGPLNLIGPAADDFLTAYCQRSDGNLTASGGIPSQLEGQVHESVVGFFSRRRVSGSWDGDP